MTQTVQFTKKYNAERLRGALCSGIPWLIAKAAGGGSCPA